MARDSRGCTSSWRGLSGLYLLGALDPDETEAFLVHLAGCPECLDHCDELGPLVCLLFGLGDEIPAGMNDSSYRGRRPWWRLCQYGHGRAVWDDNGTYGSTSNVHSGV